MSLKDKIEAKNKVVENKIKSDAKQKETNNSSKQVSSLDEMDRYM